jgi:hypothetical protein
MNKPRFVGNVITQWLKVSREMKLQQKFMFIDKNNNEWIAPRESIIDGASIPRVCWFFIGSPFVGNYRRASVIHDVYCITKSKPHKQVHKMFYQAMRCDCVNYFKAQAMYLAVKLGGPKWES